MGLGAVAGAHAIAHGNRQADGGHDDGHHAVFEEWVNHTALEKPAQHQHGQQGGQHETHQHGRTQRDEGQHHEGRQHDEFTLGEIDGAGSLPEQRKTQCRQCINAARGQA